MPHKPKRQCGHVGCPNLADGSYCPEHAKKETQRYEKERGSASQRGYDANWHKVSDMHLREFPLCERCGRKASMTHHKVKIRDGGGRYDWDNLESLCWPCHDKEHEGERWKTRSYH